MPRRRSEDDEDAALFRDAVGKVRAIASAVEPLPRKRPKPHPLQRDRDEQAVMDELLTHHLDPAAVETGEELTFQRAGVQGNVMRKLRRGQFVVEAELDLHGMTGEEARAAVWEFLRAARERGLRCVRIIHGKGLGSSNRGPVLKPLVSSWLRRRDDVLAFTSARPVDGGTGALYVLLRKL